MLNTDNHMQIAEQTDQTKEYPWQIIDTTNVDIKNIILNAISSSDIIPSSNDFTQLSHDHHLTHSPPIIQNTTITKEQINIPSFQHSLVPSPSPLDKSFPAHKHK